MLKATKYRKLWRAMTNRFNRRMMSNRRRVVILYFIFLVCIYYSFVEKAVRLTQNIISHILYIQIPGNSFGFPVASLDYQEPVLCNSSTHRSHRTLWFSFILIKHIENPIIGYFAQFTVSSYSHQNQHKLKKWEIDVVMKL